MDFQNILAPAVASRIFQIDNEIDGLSDGGLLGILGHTSRHVLQAKQGVPCRVGVDGGTAAAMPCRPRIEESQCFPTAHLPHHNAVGSHTEDTAEAVRHREGAHGTHGNAVHGLALQFRRVLDENHPVIALGDFRQKRIEKSGLAALGASRRNDVLLLPNGLEQDFLLPLRQNALGHIVLQGENLFRMLADIDGRRRHNAGEIPLEAAFVEEVVGGKVCVNGGFLLRHQLVGKRSHVQDNLLHLSRSKAHSRKLPALETILPHLAIRVHIDLEHRLIPQERENGIHTGGQSGQGNAECFFVFRCHSMNSLFPS